MLVFEPRGVVRDHFEFWLRVGAETQRLCRVCFFRAPDEIVTRRRQNARKTAAKKGRQPSKVSLELMGGTIVLTNASESMIPLKVIALLYALRWQGELVFRLWKSQAQLPLISGIRKERALVELSAKLIGLVLFQFLVMPPTPTLDDPSSCQIAEMGHTRKTENTPQYRANAGLGGGLLRLA